MGITDDYPDGNDNGIPDAFEQRLSITEILNPPEAPSCDSGMVIVELEKTPRTPQRGEWFIEDGKIQQADFDYGRYYSIKAVIIRRVLAGELP
jgi:hypothetical protein